jgi:ribonuclease J
MLSADGICIVVATVSEQDGSSVVDPEIIFRGVPSPEDEEELVNALRDAVEDSLDRSAKEGVREISMLQTQLHEDLAEYIYRRLKRRPMVLPVVVEV